MTSTVLILLCIAGFIILFLILREFFCWYAKQNQIVALLTLIHEELVNIRASKKD